jgi:hypothetical protein
LQQHHLSGTRKCQLESNYQEGMNHIPTAKLTICRPTIANFGFGVSQSQLRSSSSLVNPVAVPANLGTAPSTVRVGRFPFGSVSPGRLIRESGRVSRHLSFLHFHPLEMLQYFSNNVWIGSKVVAKMIKVCLLFGSPNSPFLVTNKM